MTTKTLEQAIYSHLTQGTRKIGKYLCFEVEMPDSQERVDLLEYDSDGTWRFYELKVSKADFKSGAAHTFRGNYNYYVMPYKLYEQVKEMIPDGIGVITCCDMWKTCTYQENPKRQELNVDANKIMLSFMQALSRENEKFMAVKQVIRKAGIA